MSLVNQVPKIVPDDFETMLNSNINVSAIPRLLGACVFPHLSSCMDVKGIGGDDLEEGLCLWPLAVQVGRKEEIVHVLGDPPHLLFLDCIISGTADTTVTCYLDSWLKKMLNPEVNENAISHFPRLSSQILLPPYSTHRS